MDIKLLEEPLLQFGKGEYICPRTGIYKYNVSDINDIRPDKSKPPIKYPYKKESL